MSYDVGGGNGYQHGEKDGVDLTWLAPRAVEVDCEKADGDVQDLAWYLMSVDLILLACVP